MNKLIYNDKTLNQFKLATINLRVNLNLTDVIVAL